VQRRLGLHLDRRSQRRYRAPANVSLYEHLRQLGLRYLTQLPRFSAPFPGNRRQVFSHECEF